MAQRGLVRHGQNWITPEEKVDLEQKAVMLEHHYLFVDGEWISPDEYESRLRAREGLVELEGGGWARQEDVEKGRSEYIKVNEHWVKPGDFVRVWMEKSGYVQDESGRRKDATAGAMARGPAPGNSP